LTNSFIPLPPCHCHPSRCHCHPRSLDHALERALLGFPGSAAHCGAAAFDAAGLGAAALGALGGYGGRGAERLAQLLGVRVWGVGC
jgi:hypothetical protein